MKSCALFMLTLFALPAMAEEGRVLVRIPYTGRWSCAAPEDRVSGLVKGIPGIVKSRMIKSSRHGRVVAEVVLLTGVPDLRYSFGGGRDSAIEPFLHSHDGLLDLLDALQLAASNLGGPLQKGLRGRAEGTRSAFLKTYEGFVLDGRIQPRWRVGVEYVKLSTRQSALLVYRVESSRRRARTWEQLRELLQSPRLVKPI
ncbi:MAG: hypothetical protein K8T20_19240 [Planctomycetes bacterium]|nr:hypothetical protein [Planctomycetota bacterium]